MSKVKFTELIDNLSGKPNKEAHVSHRTLYGVRHTYTWNPETKVKPTNARLIHRESMAQAYFLAANEMANEQNLRHWHDLARKEKYVGPINSFIVSKVHHDIKTTLLAEWLTRPLDELNAYIAQQKAARLRAKIAAKTSQNKP